MQALLNSFGWAIEGIVYASRERNIRIHLAVTITTVLLALYLGLSTIEWAVLALTIGFVLTAEVFNTAVEEIVDNLSPEWNASAKHAKDASAGAVLIAACTSVVVGLFLFGPKLVALLR